MTSLILHHYPPSPVSEKIRTGLGLKKLAWHSVEQNRLPDRPALFAMTGGYRRIPVLQIGADIYCDTQCILRELERRHPQPSFFPNNGAGLPFAISRWTDGPLFDAAVRVAFGPVAASLPPELVADRARLYLGPGGDFAQEIKDLPHVLAQLRAQLGWLETRLETGRDYILGDTPGMPDLLAWYIVWFVKDRYEHALAFFAEFERINAWAERMRAIGHGDATELTPTQALEIAQSSEPDSEKQSDDRDPQGLKPGMPISVSPLTDSGESGVSGVVRSVGRDHISLDRHHESCGHVAVHFPRVGYRVTVN